MKIEWNWGTKITIAIILFMSFIIGLVIMTTKNSIILVEKDYYPKGLVYQNKIDMVKNAYPYREEMVLKQKDNNIFLSIPKASPDSGNVVFYRPNQEKVLDFIYPFEPQTSIDLTFPKDKFNQGIYIFKISWWENDKGYYIEKKIFIN